MKKKILFASLVRVLSLSVSAQIKKGQWIVGGSAGFESSKFGDNDDSKVTSFNLSPNAGYFFINNLLVERALVSNARKKKKERQLRVSCSRRFCGINFYRLHNE